MKITHSLYEEDGQKLYLMKVGNYVLGIAYKSAKGFSFQAHKQTRPYGLAYYSFSTMAKLKEALSEFIEAVRPDFKVVIEKHQKPTRRGKFSVDDARKFVSYSHNGIREMLNEIRQHHHYMHKTDYGSYIVRRAMEEAAKWKWGDYARNWLKKNPQVGMYKPFHPDPEDSSVIQSPTNL